MKKNLIGLLIALTVIFFISYMDFQKQATNNIKVEKEEGLVEPNNPEKTKEESKKKEFMIETDYAVVKRDTPVIDLSSNEIVGHVKADSFLKKENIQEDKFIIQLENHLGYVSLNNVSETQQSYPLEKRDSLFKIETSKETYLYSDSSLTRVEYLSEGSRIHNVLDETENAYEVFFGGKTLFVNKSDVKVFKGTPVLMYHHLLEDKENKNFRTSTTITPEQFREEMEYLSENNFEIILPADLYNFFEKQQNIPANAVVITFDDGLKSNLIYAAPILRQLNLKATNFLITSRVKDEPAPFNPDKLQFLSFGELDEIKDVFGYEGHTHEMHSFSPNQKKGLLLTKSKEEIIADLKMSSNVIEQSYFAYPFGHYNEMSKEILTELGYKLAFTTKNGYAVETDNYLEVKRFGINSKTTFEEFKRIVSR